MAGSTVAYWLKRHRFGRRRLWAATADAAILFAVMARYALLARRIDQPAALLAVPEVGALGWPAAMGWFRRVVVAGHSRSGCRWVWALRVVDRGLGGWLR